MFYIKLFIIFSIFLLSLYIGILISKKYSNRVKELKEMKNALNMFETKMKFTYESIPEIFLDITGKVDKNISDIFKISSEKMNDLSAGEAWIKTIEQCENNLNEEDKNILKSLGKQLGKTDIEGQISEINLVSNFLDTQIELAETERNKNEKMYKTLGGIIGLTIGIILI